MALFAGCHFLCPFVPFCHFLIQMGAQERFPLSTQQSVRRYIIKV